MGKRGKSTVNRYGDVKQFLNDILAVRPDDRTFSMLEIKEYMDLNIEGDTKVNFYLSILKKLGFIEKVVLGTFKVIKPLPDDLAYTDFLNMYYAATNANRDERKVNILNQIERERLAELEELAAEEPQASEESALNVQVGGSHYKDLPMQPIELIAPLGLTFIQGNIIKYVSRYKSKNGIEDIKKCIHYANLGKEFDTKRTALGVMPKKKRTKILTEALDKYFEANSFTGYVQYIIYHATMDNWDSVIYGCNKLILELTSANDIESLL